MLVTVASFIGVSLLTQAAKAEFELAQGVEARDRAGIHYAAVLIASPSSDDIREGRMIAEGAYYVRSFVTAQK